MIRFTRSHGLGNDYLILRESDPPLSLTPPVVSLLCDRHRGIGSDGILLPTISPRGEVGVRIFNPDGSEAEKSGNGLRIFARYLYDTGYFPPEGEINTLGGRVRASIYWRAGAPAISVDMGPPDFDTSRIPVNVPQAQAIDIELALSRTNVRGTAVSMGNPHWVMFVEELEAIPLDTLAPEIEHHHWFPNRTNVQFARVLTRGHVQIRIWERGAGHTMASGSSACAVVAAGIKTGRLDSAVVVSMEGGDLHVQQEPTGNLLQEGPVTVIATGQVAPDLEAELRALG